MTPEERYFCDPQFHALVDTIGAMIERCEFTPTEIREAAMLAAMRHDQRTLQPRFLAALKRREPT